MSATIIRNGRVIDPANNRNEIAEVYIADGKIVTSKSEVRSEVRNPKLKRSTRVG